MTNRVLVDLSHAAAGHVGIAQDLRLIFSMLCDIPGVEPAGLLMPTGRHDLPRLSPAREGDPALSAAVLHWMARNWTRLPEGKLARARALPRELWQILRPSHGLMRATATGQMNALWRILFDPTLPAAARAAVLARPYYATDLSVARLIDRTVHLPFLPPKRLEAGGFDYALFCMPRPVRLPPGVRQLVRFHDAVPVMDIDTVANPRIGAAHQALVRGCAPDAVFICNSPQSLDDLLALDPRRAGRAVVIPCALAPGAAAASPLPFSAIAAARASFRAIGAEAAPAGWRPPTDQTRYVLAVSTLEPRKNYPGLIRAFEQVKARAEAPDLRLVIVGGAGWREDEVLRAMRPHVAGGRILHLTGVPKEELGPLMRGAACFAQLSYNEGFGLAPLEALAAGTPAVLSDIPVCRWIFGEAALYADPYDSAGIAAQIERLTTHPDRAALRQSLLAQGEAVVARFSMASVRDEWRALFERLPALV
jgi:glycosyltransferase involved in cell wall biosynthesis